MSITGPSGGNSGSKRLSGTKQIGWDSLFSPTPPKQTRPSHSRGQSVEIEPSQNWERFKGGLSKIFCSSVKPTS